MNYFRLLVKNVAAASSTDHYRFNQTNRQETVDDLLSGFAVSTNTAG